MNTQSIYNGLDYTTKEINRNFKVKVNGIVNGKKVNMLVGMSGLIKIVGDIKLVNRLLKRAFNCYGDKEVCKLRRGVKITFYNANRMIEFYVTGKQYDVYHVAFKGFTKG